MFGKSVNLRIVWGVVVLLSALGWPATGRAGAASDTPPDRDLVIHGDALVPPDVGGGIETKAEIEKGYYQTSDYMIGRVAVGLIFAESDGGQEAQSEDWTDAEIARVQDEVEDALAWWASLEPSAHLTFTLETRRRVPTGYEPIDHGLGQERLWIGETMAALGFENENYFRAVRDYVNDLRDRLDTDWAFAILVVDSSADPDGRFADGYFAYAYIGGPFLVVTYDNGPYGPHNMDAVVAHETGHIFRALDQYAAAGIKCDYRAGYLNVQNGNSLAGGACESDVPSIMRGGITPFATGALDHFARGQIGWWDSDGDGVLDPVDAESQITIALEAVAGENDDLFLFDGQAWLQPVPSPVLADVTINHVADVGAVVDGAGWTAAIPGDGQFDTLSETFSLQVGPLPPGLHTIEVQAINAEGQVSSWVTTTFVYDPVDGALNTVLQEDLAAAPGSESLHFGGLATAAYGDAGPGAPVVAGVQFQVDGGQWQAATADDGQFDDAIERFSISLTDLPAGEHRLAVRAVDSDGLVEVNVEQRQFRVETPTFYYFLPLAFR